MTQKIAYLDCHSGVSGSILLAALLDAGFSLDILRKALVVSPLRGYQLQYDTVHEKGIRGSRISVVLEEQEPTHSLSDSIAILHTLAISTHARDTAMSIFSAFSRSRSSYSGNSC